MNVCKILLFLLILFSVLVVDCVNVRACVLYTGKSVAMLLCSVHFQRVMK